jgi:cellulose synthase/poly-beta-1,6-N-acetylglucosamine synthase-like glycosyltransferase
MYIRRKIFSILYDSTKTYWEKFICWTKLFYDNLNYHYYLLISILLILGMSTPFFDTLVLVCELFKRNETFFEIGKAIIESLGQLLVVLLILLISNYILVIFIYYYYANNYTPCANTLYQCLSFGLDIALKQDYGVVGYNDSSTSLLTDFLSDNAFDVVFDFFYLFIIKIIV